MATTKSASEKESTPKKGAAAHDSKADHTKKTDSKSESKSDSKSASKSHK